MTRRAWNACSTNMSRKTIDLLHHKILHISLTGLTQVMCHNLFQTSPAACKNYAKRSKWEGFGLSFNSTDKPTHKTGNLPTASVGLEFQWTWICYWVFVCPCSLKAGFLLESNPRAVRDVQRRPSYPPDIWELGHCHDCPVHLLLYASSHSTSHPM